MRVRLRALALPLWCLVLAVVALGPALRPAFVLVAALALVPAAVAAFTPWYAPWGGHETAPWHYLGGRRARQRYIAKHGHEPKNRFGESLFPVTIQRDVIALRYRPVT